MSSTIARVIKNTGFLYARMAVTMFTTLYSTRLILNALGFKDFGIYNIVGGTIAMLGFLNATMSSATQRFMNHAEGKSDMEAQKSIFNVSLTLHFSIAVIIGMVLILAGFFLFNGILNIDADRVHAAKIVYYCLIASTMFSVMTVPYEAVLNAHENMLCFSIVGAIQSLLTLGVAFVINYAETDRLVLYGILTALVFIIIMLIFQIYCRRRYDECVFAPLKYYNRNTLKEMTSYAGWNFLTTSTSMVSLYGMGLILNHFFGTLLNAAQGIANQLAGYLNFFSNNMLKALTPVIMKREGAGNREQMLDFALLGSKYSFLILAVLAVPTIFEARYICILWLGKVTDWVVLFAQLQIIRSLFDQIAISLGSAIEATGDIKLFNIIRSILRFLPIPLVIALFYCGFEPYWLYIIWIVFAAAGVAVWYVILAQIKLGLHITKYMRIVGFPCLGIALTMVIACFIVEKNFPMGFARLALCYLAAGISFIVAYLWSLSPQEKLMLQSFKKRILHR